MYPVPNSQEKPESVPIPNIDEGYDEIHPDGRRNQEAQHKPLILPWEQQPGEDARKFEAFKIYKNLGPERSVAKVTEAIWPGYAKENGRAIKPVCSKWAYEWKWTARAEAWDRELDRQINITQIIEIKRMCRHHAGVARSIIQKGLEALQRVDISRLANSPDSILKYLIEGSKLEKASMGVAETIERVEHVSIEVKEMQQEEDPHHMRAVLAILEEAGAIPKFKSEIIDVEVLSGTEQKSLPSIDASDEQIHDPEAKP